MVAEVVDGVGVHEVRKLIGWRLYFHLAPHMVYYYYTTTQSTISCTV